MRLERPGEELVLVEIDIPSPAADQVLIKVSSCGVCRTDLHVVDGDLEDPKLPIVPGHEVIGIVTELGSNVSDLEIGERVGVPWLGHTCQVCTRCLSGHENLCDEALFTGYQLDGGYAEYMLADARYALPIQGDYSDIEAAPLLCAGLIGYRSWKFTTREGRLGIYGFGAAAHIVVQIAKARGQEVFAFSRPGDTAAQEFAIQTGADWAGGSDEAPPEALESAIIFAPAGELVPLALTAVDKGGIVVCGGIHMSNIPEFPYRSLWGERTIRSVANLTRADGVEFLKLAPEIPIHTRTTPYPLEKAGEALNDLREGRLEGAAVLVMD